MRLIELHIAATTADVIANIIFGVFPHDFRRSANPCCICDALLPHQKGFLSIPFFWVSSHKIDRSLSHGKKNPADDVASESSTTDEGKATQIHACSRKVHPPRKVQPTCAPLAVKVCLSTSSLNYFAIYFNKFHILWHYIPFPGPKINNAHNAATHDLYLPTTHTHMRSIWHTKKKEEKTWSQFKTENCPKQRPIFLFRDFSLRPNSPLFWAFGVGRRRNGK